jgi:hypothetical protein
MIDDSDPGVALTVTTLITAMAQDALEAFSGCYQKAVKRLDRVSRRAFIRLCQLTLQIIFDGDYPPEYVYYKVCRARVISLRSGADFNRCPIRGCRSSSCASCSTTHLQASRLCPSPI